MTMKKILLATTMLIAGRAFANPGWKMDGDKMAVDASGNPIWVGSDGAESAVKGDTIANLNTEAKAHRTAKEAAETTLKTYMVGGKLIDPVIATKAIETVSKIDAKQLIDAGEVDKVRDAIKLEFTGQLSEKDKAINELTATNRTMTVDRTFDSSEFVRSRIAVPVDMFRDSFGKNIRVADDGKLEYLGRDGNRLMSKKNVGEYATGDEAFELMVEQHPQKDTILKAVNNGGSGNNGGGGGRPTGRVVKRADFNVMSPADQAATGAKAGAGEITIVD